jgi:DNA-binding transcriptional LysR family regulator
VGVKPRAETWIGEMHLFVAVARARSFTRAAQALNMPHSSLSRRISELEKALGLRLLKRTTRKVELTEEGEKYLERAEHVVADAVAIHEELRYRRDRPSGLLRISIPECIALQVATPWIAEFSALYPDVSVHIDTAPEHADLIRQDFELLITHVTVREPSYVTRTIASLKRQLFASPAYLKKHGTPSAPEELVEHQCICMGENRSAASLWTLVRGREKKRVEVSGPVTTLSQVLAPELAKEGAGIAPAMPVPIQHYLDAGLLVPVLSEWQSDPLVISIAVPHVLMAARTRAFIEFFTAKYKATSRQWQSSRAD